MVGVRLIEGGVVRDGLRVFGLSRQMNGLMQCDGAVLYLLLDLVLQCLSSSNAMSRCIALTVAENNSMILKCSQPVACMSTFVRISQRRGNSKQRDIACSM